MERLKKWDVIYIIYNAMQMAARPVRDFMKVIYLDLFRQKIHMQSCKQ